MTLSPLRSANAALLAMSIISIAINIDTEMRCDQT